MSLYQVHMHGGEIGALRMHTSLHLIFITHKGIPYLIFCRQILGVVLGLLWGVVAVKGIIGLAVFAALNAGVLYLYFRYVYFFSIKGLETLRFPRFHGTKSTYSS